jgi:hypothetical protein
VSTGGSIESNVRLFEAFVTIYLSITIINYTKYLIIKLSLLKKAQKKRNNEIIIQYLTGSMVKYKSPFVGLSMVWMSMSGVKIKNFAQNSAR